MTNPTFIVVDLFCGAGGTTTGFHMTNGIAEVIACVNHDPIAIKSHHANYPNVKHYEEDIRTLDLTELIELVAKYRNLYPTAKLILWASLECTHFSKARGGLSRDADSRTLAHHLLRYITDLNPEYIQIENVREFMSWGPLDENGKPISKLNGQDYDAWKESIQILGYEYKRELLNSADFGAHTRRIRYFGCFHRPELPAPYPVPTHAKVPVHGVTKKYRAVKEVLQLEEEGKSIFNRKKPLVENTLKRIYAGLEKFIAKGETSFIKKYFSGRPAGKVISVNGPAGTITTIDHQTLVNCDFILKYNSMKKGKHNPPSVEEPLPTIACQNRLGKVCVNFLQSYYGNGNAHSTEKPCPTITCNDRFAYMVMSYSGGGQLSDINNPAPTITTNPKHNLVHAENFIMNPQFGNKGADIKNPCPTIIARQDKKPLYLIHCSLGEPYMIPVYESDTPTMQNIKVFMAAFGITDIKMRMLFVDELKRIQGFPADYILEGTQKDQKKFIGNSVPPVFCKVWAEAINEELLKLAA